MEKAKICILGDEIGTVSPLIYGHFAEHIGGVIYDGIWVGKDSPIPNINGFRLDLVEKFKKTNFDDRRYRSCRIDHRRIDRFLLPRRFYL